MSSDPEARFRRGPTLRVALAIIALVAVGLAAFLLTARLTQVDTTRGPAVRLPAASSPTATPTPLTDIGRAALSSVVTVEAELPSEVSLGTAWLFDTKGDYVTNAHVIAGQIAIRVTDRQNQTHRAIVLGVDTTADIAVLRVTGASGSPLPIDTSAIVVVPMDVIVVAASRATGQMDLTPDAVIELHKDVPLSTGNLRPGTSGPTVYHDMLHLEGAKIYEGNSGGPVLDGSGQIVGVVTLASPSAPDAYAIPITRVLAELQQLAAKTG